MAHLTADARNVVAKLLFDHGSYCAIVVVVANQISKLYLAINFFLFKERTALSKSIKTQIRQSILTEILKNIHLVDKANLYDLILGF